jgi:hypothetical protein
VDAAFADADASALLEVVMQAISTHQPCAGEGSRG